MIAARQGHGTAALLAAATVGIILLTPQLLLSYYGGGVANLPMLTLTSLTIGLVAPALARRLPSGPVDPAVIT